jgi:HK97 family phage prohead protease
MTLDIVRAHPGGFGLRGVDGSPPTLTGHFAVFNQWTTIRSVTEGTFLERVAPGAFAATFRDDRAALRCLFQHGKDPQVGDKPLGPVTVLAEDERGAYYEVPMLDTSYNRDLEPGLRAGLYGSSFRFKVTAVDFAPRVKRSAWNPDALPERTILAAHVYEMGPVTFPAYAGTTAGVRSLTDWYHR